jgi:predicted N-acetyltransferase YhbS
VTGIVGPELLGPDHDTTGFDCGDAALNDWLRTRGLRKQRAGSSRTWVAREGSRVVAYYASTSAALPRALGTRRAARNQPDPLPAMLLARLAVDAPYQGRGLGAALLKHFVEKSLDVAEMTGVRIMVVHAKSTQAAAFYARYGFEPSPMDALTMTLLVQDARA